MFFFWTYELEIHFPILKFAYAQKRKKKKIAFNDFIPIL